MTNNPQNKIALITGGSRGLGRNMSEAIARNGNDVILTYNSNRAAAEEVVAVVEALGRKAVALQLDTSNTASFPAFIDTLRDTLQAWEGSHFHFLINNAGTALYAPAAHTTEAQLDEMYHIHFKGPFFLTQHCLPLLADGGGIVNISSGLARMTLPGSSGYASMKAAIETYTRYLAKELGERRIRVNVVAPGAIETDFGGGRVRDTPEFNKMVAGMTALGRTGLPDDIGPVVAFLCSEEARWVNAQRLEVSGGQAL